MTERLKCTKEIVSLYFETFVYIANTSPMQFSHFSVDVS